MKLSKTYRKKIKNQNILISGGAGFIGSYLIEECIKQKAKKIIVLDNLSVGKLENIQHIKNKIIFKKIDCENLNKIKTILKKYKVDVVFNLATIALPFSFKYPRKTLETNTIITLNFLELLKNKQYKTLCHFSSSEVYGTAKFTPMSEVHPKNPTTTYAAGKMAADLAIQAYVKMFDLDAFILRPFNNYGPRQLITRDEIGVIPKTVKRILKNLKPIIYGSGKQIRDFIFVKDTVFYAIKIYSKIKPGKEVNICSNNPVKIVKLIKQICKILNKKPIFIYKKERTADVYCHHGCNKEMKKLVTLKKTNFEHNLKKTIEYYIEQYGKEK